MSADDPTPDRPAPGDPFAGEPQSLRGDRGGCSRMLLIGCAAAAILIGVGVLAMMLKARDLVVWSLDNVRSEIEQSLPDDLPEAERERLDAAFDSTLEKLDQGELDPEAFRRLQSVLLEFARLGGSVDRDDVRTLTEALDRFATESPPPPEAPRDDTPREGAPAGGEPAPTTGLTS